MSERAQLRQDFLARQGLHDARIAPLAGDASFRRYFRLAAPSGSLVLMDAPPPQEDVRPFARLARHLDGLGFSVPRVLGEDAEHGFLLLEDFGDLTYSRALQEGADERELYALAVDVLLALHEIPASRALLPGLPRYETEEMADKAGLLMEWYPRLATGTPADAALCEEYRALWRQVLPALDAGPRTLVLRDYHVDNLMLLPDRAGIRRCGLLDFQDAARGATAYDLASLIEDARRDIDPVLYRTMLDRYLNSLAPADRLEFLAALAICAAQRHSRVIGVFARLKLRDDKGHYLQHLPRLWRLFERALRHEALAPLRRFVDRHIPTAQRQGAA
ncbi:MAG: aminoglycoside phosphotransferase family protein [Reyranellaceae bacterium]